MISGTGTGTSLSGGGTKPAASSVSHWVEAQIGLSQAIVSVESRSTVLGSEHVLSTVMGLAKSVVEQFLDAAALEHHGVRLRGVLLADRIVFSSFLAHAAELFGLEYLYATARLNPALPTAMGALVQSEDLTLAALTREFLGAHVRTVQSLRRQELAVQDLPGEAFASALALATKITGPSARFDSLRAEYDEAKGRITLVRRLARAIDAIEPRAAIDVSRFGFTLTAAMMAERAGMALGPAVMCLVGDAGCVADFCADASLTEQDTRRLMSFLPAGGQL